MKKNQSGIPQLVPLEEAQERWINELEFQKITPLTPPETISVKESRGRVTAEIIYAKVSSPHFYMSAIDGMTVKSSDTFLASETPIKLKIGKQAIFIDTGMPIPEGFNAVIPIDEVKFHSVEIMEISRPANPWQNIKPVGEDLAAKEVIIPNNYLIRSLDVGAMLTGGVTSLKVREKPKAGIISVGEELVSPGNPLKVGQIYESTSYILSNLATEYGALPRIYKACKKNKANIKARIKTILKEVDFLTIIAGKSEGTKLLAEIISEMGDLILFGVNSKPGQSVCAGIIGNKCILGLPCYPVSTFISFELFAKPVIYKMLGIKFSNRETIRAILGREINSPEGIDEFLRVKIGLIDSKIVAVPISRGADILMSLVEADGIIKIESELTNVSMGSEVMVELLTAKENLKNNLLIAGTHDICLDIIGNTLLKNTPAVCLYSSNVGSHNGIKAIKEGNTHLAGIHLFDLETGEYNVPTVKKMLKNIPIILVNLFHRHLGLIVKKGNPKKIKDLHDLIRDDIKFINRNFTSGTRVVIDYFFAKLGINKEGINGYKDEVYNHMSLAAAISSGSADVGIGILAAARSLKLDFIPVIPERFDIIVPKIFLGNKNVQAFLQLLETKEFKKEVSALGGYDLTYTGKIYYDF